MTYAYLRSYLASVSPSSTIPSMHYTVTASLRIQGSLLQDIQQTVLSADLVTMEDLFVSLYVSKLHN